MAVNVMVIVIVDFCHSTPLSPWRGAGGGASFSPPWGELEGAKYSQFA